MLASQGVSAQGPRSMRLRVVGLVLGWGVMLLLWYTLGGLGHGASALFGVLLGFAIAAAVMGFWHDATHGTAFATRLGNRLAVMFVNLVGFSAIPWLKKHCERHHNETNLPVRDDDLGSGFVLRLHPAQRWRVWHQAQHIYALPLYLLLGFKWVYFDDASHLITNRFGLNSTQRIWGWIEWAGARAAHAGLYLLIPGALWSDWSVVLVGYVCMMAVAGGFPAIIFQLAHVTTNVSTPVERHSNRLAHHLSTTNDFATGAPLLTALIGGLNYQVEHHVVPGVCSVHLPRVQPIVAAYAAEFDLPYHAIPTLRGAIGSHLRQLRNLGKPEQGEMP